MLSYRHGFHAGNHADLLKHLCLLALLRAMCIKPGALCYFESHAGAGRYRLDSEFARQTGEFEQGVGRLRGQTCREPLLQDYQQLQGLSSAADASYLGSPAIAQAILRPQDALHLCEMHPTDAQQLRQHTRHDSRVHVHVRDGFTAIPALLPPTQKRGLVLIDPAYELKSDYAACVAAIKDLRRRFRSAVIALWFPRLPRLPARPMLDALSKLPATESLLLTLDVREAIGDYGMYGSGMLILQPPWQLQATLAPALTEATALLGAGARWSQSQNVRSSVT